VLGEYDSQIGERVMITCQSCGWEITTDFDLWIDSMGGAVCFWDKGVEKPHYPRVLVSA
jgi:hypothetical protein